MRQSNLREYVWEPCVLWKFKAHIDQVPLYHGYGVERSNQAPVHGNEWADSKRIEQTSS